MSEGRTEPRELVCSLCGVDYPAWFAPNDLYNAVMRLPDGTDRSPFPCPTCFARMAEKSGVCWRFRLTAADDDGAPRTAAVEPKAAYVVCHRDDWGIVRTGTRKLLTAVEAEEQAAFLLQTHMGWLVLESEAKDQR